MNRPVLAFFNNKGGVGKTMLAYHVAWMLNELGHSVVVLDLDPQANLTASFLEDDRVEKLWNGSRTVYGALAPLFEGEGGIADPHVEEIANNLGLVPGDLLLSGTEQQLSLAWPGSLEGQVRDLRVMGAFGTIAQRAAELAYAEVVLVDVGPNLGAINRAAMAASDHVVIPIRPDLYSLQGLRNLGPTLGEWRNGWHDRVERAARAARPDLRLSGGEMRPRGYVVLQHGTRVDRVVGAYDRWLRRVPAEYHRSVLGEIAENPPLAVDDPNCLGMIKHYYSLAPMAQEVRKPVFLLRSADGAIGAHQQAVRDSYGHFAELTGRLLTVVGLDGSI